MKLIIMITIILQKAKMVYDMKKKAHIIKEIEEGSIAEELELKPGDVLISINGTEIKDIFDYHYMTKDDEITLLIRKPDGEEWELEIEKDYDEDLGIVFEEGLMDEYRSCRNKCIFCFIDQMPPGMRETLYFKDYDARLSFLQGNYITLTNMSDENIERILFYKLSPINISIHTTNEELRCKMLHNRFAGEALKKIKKLSDGGITMNGQIVLCKGWNDGKELERTLSDLVEYIPQLQSVSVVPVGLTKFRKGLEKLEKFNKEDSIKVIDIIHRWQTIFLEKYGTRLVYASD
jgi:putative radical SAM enzyme (TIGR03279 family)